MAVLEATPAIRPGPLAPGAPPSNIGRDPFSLLRELLADDRRAGIELTPEDFAQRVHLVGQETRSRRSWRWAVVDTYPAWAAAYTRERGPGHGLVRDLLDDAGTRESCDDPGGL